MAYYNQPRIKTACMTRQWPLYMLMNEAGLHGKTRFKGTVPSKNDQIKKYASIEVSTCSGCCCGILQLCNLCKGGLGGLNGTTIYQHLRNVCRKIALVKSSILQLLKNRTLTVFELRNWYWYQKKQHFVIYKAVEFFFQNFEKYFIVWSFSFLGKNAFFWKKNV